MKRIIISILLIIIFLTILIYAIININYFINKKDYKETINIQGNKNYYVPQSITYSKKYNVVIQTSYNKKHKVSRIYITNFKTNKLIKTLNLKNKDNTNNTSHVGGITTNDEILWITNNNSIDEFSLKKILNTNKNYIKSINNIKIPIRGDFITYKDNYLYVGDFFLYPFYKVKDNNPLLLKYKINDYSKPVEKYSLPKMVQGLAITDDNTFIFTRSYTPLINSKLSYYNINNNKLILKQEIKIPPMAEGLFIKDNELYILFENSSNSYLYADPKITKILKRKQ